MSLDQENKAKIIVLEKEVLQKKSLIEKYHQFKSS